MEIIKKVVGGSVVLTPIGRIELNTADAFKEQLLGALDEALADPAARAQPLLIEVAVAS